MRDSILICQFMKWFVVLHHAMHDQWPGFRGNTVVRLFWPCSPFAHEQSRAGVMGFIVREPVLFFQLQPARWGKEEGGNWRQRSRRASSSLSPIFSLFLIPSGVLYQKVQHLQAGAKTTDGSYSPVMKHRRPGPKHLSYDIPTSEWPTVVQRVLVQKEPLLAVAVAYGVSHETIRRILHHHPHQQQGQQDA
jgi:hypothetical protein